MDFENAPKLIDGELKNVAYDSGMIELNNENTTFTKQKYVTLNLAKIEFENSNK